MPTVAGRHNESAAIRLLGISNAIDDLREHLFYEFSQLHLRSNVFSA